jgi:hypothetical protein
MSEQAKLFEDTQHRGDWRVERVDDDGGCEVAIFSGPQAKHRAILFFVAYYYHHGETLEAAGAYC